MRKLFFILFILSVEASAEPLQLRNLRNKLYEASLLQFEEDQYQIEINSGGSHQIINLTRYCNSKTIHISGDHHLAITLLPGLQTIRLYYYTSPNIRVLDDAYVDF